MRLGVFSVCDTYPSVGADPDRLEGLLGLVQRAEALGYRHFWVTEHHFQAGGVVPAPPVWLAAAARETVRIRLGSLVSVLPLHHPVELAEQYNIVDRLSHGRLEIGLGTGYLTFEFDGLDRVAASRQADFDRDLPRFLRALAGEPLRGGSPRPAGELRVNVASWQRPHAPIWRAVGRLEGARAAGRSGLGLALVPYACFDTLEEMGQLIEVYRRALPPDVPPRVLAAIHVVAGPDVDGAERALQRFLDSRPVVAEAAYRAVLAQHPVRGSAPALRSAGLALIGEDERLAAQLSELDGLGVTDLAAMVDFGGLSADAWSSTLERLPSLLRDRPQGPPASREPAPLPEATIGIEG